MSGPSRGAPQPAQPADARHESARRSLPPRLAAIYAGLTSFAVLAGLACYFLLAQVGMSAVLAAILGLAFAFMTRIAAASLVREWLMRAAARARERSRPSR